MQLCGAQLSSCVLSLGCEATGGIKKKISVGCLIPVLEEDSVYMLAY